jgi:peptide-methionine (S)-S-oxide reductase
MFKVFSALAARSARATRMIRPEEALPGRARPDFQLPTRYAVSGRPLSPPWPEAAEVISLGMGCFWGAERRLARVPGVWVTAVGYQGGYTPHPNYKEVCSGKTGHAEVVRVVYLPGEDTLGALLGAFFEGHDPTQGHRQGNDVGSQYRSAIYTSLPAQLERAQAIMAAYDQLLRAAGTEPITTELCEAGPFYLAEESHQQYLHKNPDGYCGLGGTGVSCPVEVGRSG